MKPLHFLTVFIMGAMLLSCNNMNRNGENTSPEGTTVTNSVNAEMEDHRVPAGTDTIPSPGSNSRDLNTTANTTNKGTAGQSGSNPVNSPIPEPTAGGTTDKNMKGQDGTHGKKTNDGDNGAVK